MEISTKANSSLSYTGIAREIVTSVVDNYLFEPNDLITAIKIDADLKSVFNVIWKTSEFRITTRRNFDSITFNFVIHPNRGNDFIEFDVVYSWVS